MFLKTNQQKLISRVFAKEYLSKLRNSTVKELVRRGAFRNPLETTYHFDLIPTSMINVENIVSDHKKIVKKLDFVFRNDVKRNAVLSHKLALENEVKRRKDEEIKKQLEKEKLKELKKQRIEEQIRLKKEQERLSLKKEIYSELLKACELVDEPYQEGFDVFGSMQINKKYGTIFF